MAEYQLPDVGEGLTEADIVTWRVAVGDEVSVNQIIVEIETAKSLVELPSPYAGTVTALLVAEGDTVEVGTPIIAIGEEAVGEEAVGDGDGAGQETSEPAAADGAGSAATAIDLSNPAASGGGEGESLVGRNMPERSGRRRRRGGATEPAAQQARTPGPERALAKPPVRKLAKDLGVDLSALTPSGPHGDVTREDVARAAEQPAAAASGTSDGSAAVAVGPYGADQQQSSDGEWREPVKGVRKAMAQAMVQSSAAIPHVTEWVTVDVTATVRLVASLQQRRELADVRVSPLLVLARAAMLAMRRTPQINSRFDDESQEVVFSRSVNLGIAAATPRGLVVPNIKGADRLGLADLAAALRDLTTTAREGRTPPEDMAGGTFTITNVGVFGVDAGTPIINPGEAAILCFGAIRREPWVVADESAAGERIEPRDVTTLALSFDHRHIDGEAGSRYLADVAGVLHDPGTALLL